MGCTGSKLVAAEPNAENNPQQASFKNQMGGDTAPLKKPRQARLSLAGGYSQYENMNQGGQAFDNESGRNHLSPGVPSGVAIHYAYLSQRGHYPDQPNKANQDAVLIRENVNGVPGQHLLGVLDGHGETGAECAQFAKAKVKTIFYFFLLFSSFSYRQRNHHPSAMALYILPANSNSPFIPPIIISLCSFL